MRARLLSLAAALLAACEHGAPFRPADYGPEGPFDPTPPVRLTRNLLADRHPIWLPDGRTILYSADRADRSDGDRCLAMLPAGGGAIARYLCHQTGGGADSVDAFEFAAAGADGRLAFVHASAPVAAQWPVAPYFRTLVRLAPGGSGQPEPLRTLPYFAPSDSLHQALSHLSWLGADTLVYVGTHVAYPRPCSSCAPDTLQWGIEIALLDLSNGPPQLSVVPGTLGASSVSAGAGDTIYYTLNGDTRVFRRALGSGDTATVHDFAAAGIVRDVTVRGPRLVAIVGGDVSYEVDPVLGPVQRDGGGILYLVDLTTGAETVPVDPNVRYRRPALSAGGAQVVAEVVTGRGTDVWLVELP